jgi:hypothetical protein
MTDRDGFFAICNLLSTIPDFARVEYGPFTAWGPKTALDYPRLAILPDSWKLEDLFDTKDGASKLRTVTFFLDVTTRNRAGFNPIIELSGLADLVEEVLVLNPIAETVSEYTQVTSGSYTPVHRTAVDETTVRLRGQFAYLRD